MAFPASIDLSTLNGITGFKLNGVEPSDASGWSVAPAGDVNGDGFDDVIIGAWHVDSRGRYSGASYVVFGKALGFAAETGFSTLDGANGFLLAGASEFDQSGFSVASAGDVNGDGYADLIIGAPGTRQHGLNTGASYVVFGKASGFDATFELSAVDGLNGFRLLGDWPGSMSGFSVSSAGDFNGDGFDDVIVGAPQAGEVIYGASYVVFGKASGFAASVDLSTLDGSSGFRLDGQEFFDQFGHSVAGAGDVNGDGYHDLIVGAIQDRGAGVSYVVFGKAASIGANLDLSSLNGATGFKLNGTSAFDLSGRSVGSAGDVNGDGFGDLIIGASGADPNGSSSGASYVVFGKSSGFAADIDLGALDGVSGFRLSGAATGDWSGGSVASSGDFNGDGYGDLIVGAVGADPNGSYSGATYVVFGKASGFVADLNLSALDGINGFRLDGVAAHDRLGGSPRSAGDVNGDGFDDLIIGAYGADPGGDSSGATYIVFGGAFGAIVTTAGTAAAEMLIGGAGDDVLTGGGGPDVFHAGAGDDTLVVTDTTFRLADGGNGVDTLVLAGAGLGLVFSDPLVAARLEGIERIDLTGTGSNDVRISQMAVLGGIGAVVGGKHILTVLGDVGDTVLFAEPQWGKTATFANADGTFDRYAFGNAIVDVEQGISVPGATVNGNSGNDTISLTTTVAGQPFATNRNDVLRGGAGSDVLDGGAGEDTMVGGTGNDTYGVDNVGDVVVEFERGGVDTIDTTLATYALGANVENLRFVGIGDFIGIGHGLANTLTGSTGNDTLDGKGGVDTLIGGAGDDICYVDSAKDQVFETVGGGNDTIYTSVSYALRSGEEIENLAVDPSEDYAGSRVNLRGNEFANIQTGNAAGNTLDGNGGADTMRGGDGDDTYHVDHSADAVVEGANHGADTVYTTVSHRLAANVEILRALGSGTIALTGNDAANTLVGNAGANRIDGDAGADAMTGGVGNDTYVVDDPGDTIWERSGGGIDTVEASVSFTLANNVENLVLTGTSAIDGRGNTAGNTIVGNDAANTINGNGGLDTLTGGGGADTFVFAVKLHATTNFAKITDFEHGIDRIALDDAFFKSIGVSGSLRDAFFTTSAPITREQHVIYDQGTGNLSYDIDGSGARSAIKFAQVAPGTLLDHHDFLIV